MFVKGITYGRYALTERDPGRHAPCPHVLVGIPCRNGLRPHTLQRQSCFVFATEFVNDGIEFSLQVIIILIKKSEILYIMVGLYGWNFVALPVAGSHAQYFSSSKSSHLLLLLCCRRQVGRNIVPWMSYSRRPVQCASRKAINYRC